MKEIKENKLGSFECACHDRDHVIRADHWNLGPGEEHYHEVNFNFIIYLSSWKANKDYYGNDNFIKEKWLDFMNFFRRIIWRISKALELLFTGCLRIESDWLATTESFEGLRKWMNQTAKIIKNDKGTLI